MSSPLAPRVPAAPHARLRVLVLGAILLPHLPPLHNWRSWEAVAQCAPHIKRFDYTVPYDMPF